MPHPNCLMLDTAKNTNIDAVTLLIHYSFDLGSYSAKELTDFWTHDYSANWVRFAVIEALYQGRYKAISVEQILAFWQRRGVASHHFNHEFERLVCGNLPQKLAVTDTPSQDTVSEQNKIVSNNGSDGVKASGTGEEVTGIVDATTKIQPAKNSFTQELIQSSHQTSNNEKARQRSLSQASPSNTNHSPIEHFTPQVDDSGDFYTKLKVLAQRPEAEQN